ncbi:hypothetical protein ACJX0J_016181, partial [Zea mays]
MNTAFGVIGFIYPNYCFPEKDQEKIEASKAFVVLLIFSLFFHYHRLILSKRKNTKLKEKMDEVNGNFESRKIEIFRAVTNKEFKMHIIKNKARREELAISEAPTTFRDASGNS